MFQVSFSCIMARPKWNLSDSFSFLTLITRFFELIVHTLFTLQMSHFLTKQQPVQQILKNGHLVTQNMGCFQGLAILIVVCTVIICALQILCFFLLKKTRNVSSSRINEDLNGHNREPGDPREINIQWPHLNGRKQPIEHSEQPFNQAGFMTIT